MYKRIKSIIGLGLMFSLLLFVIAWVLNLHLIPTVPAELQKNLFMFTFWIAVVVFIIVEGGILYSHSNIERKMTNFPFKLMEI